MPSPLHKVPTGLLELFRLKTLGRAPDEFANTVIPTCESLEAYAAPEMNSALGAPTVGSIVAAGGLQQTVAVGSFQWIWGIGGALTLGAAPGTIIDWAVGFIIGSGSTCILGCGERRPIVAGNTVRFGITLPRPLVLRAGSLWFVQVNGDAAGADHSLTPAALFVPAANLT